MAFEFKFPDIGEGLTEGEIVRWLVKEGDEIKEGQPLVEVETDKALAEIPSPKTGVVQKILAKEKEIVKVGQVIVVIAEKGESVAVASQKGEAAKAAPPKPKSVGVVGELEEAPEETPAGAVEEKTEPAKPAFVSEHALATPAVRALARELGVKIDKVKGTGSGGRVLERDVRQAAESREKPEEKVEKPAEKPAEITAKVRKYDLYGYVERIPLKGIRRSIAKAMVISKYTAPHVTAIDEADITDLWEIREKE